MLDFLYSFLLVLSITFTAIRNADGSLLVSVGIFRREMADKVSGKKPCPPVSISHT